jgi:hypothetical protein
LTFRSRLGYNALAVKNNYISGHRRAPARFRGSNLSPGGRV